MDEHGLWLPVHVTFDLKRILSRVGTQKHSSRACTIASAMFLVSLHSGCPFSVAPPRTSTMTRQTPDTKIPVHGCTGQTPVSRRTLLRSTCRWAPSTTWLLHRRDLRNTSLNYSTLWAKIFVHLPVPMISTGTDFSMQGRIGQNSVSKRASTKQVLAQLALLKYWKEKHGVRLGWLMMVGKDASTCGHGEDCVSSLCESGARVLFATFDPFAPFRRA